MAKAKAEKELRKLEEEKARQAEVRRIYIDAIKRNFKSQLDNIKVVEDDEKTVH